MIRTQIAVLLILVVVVAGYLYLRPKRVWELRVERNGKTHYTRGFDSEEACYRFYEANRGNRNYVHGCYPVR